MKRILYPVVLFVMISQHAIAQCITDCKQKIILTFYKTEYCSSDMERNYISAVESDRFNSADSISYVAENTLVLYKNKEVIDTLFLKTSNSITRGMYIYTDGVVASLNNSYSNSTKNVIKVDKKTYRRLRELSDDYNPNADHSSHMSHFSSR